VEHVEHVVEVERRDGGVGDGAQPLAQATAGGRCDQDRGHAFMVSAVADKILSHARELSRLNCAQETRCHPVLDRPAPPAAPLPTA
jgi:hypothetical protein